ncbi:hypothetical protein KUV22_15820 [Microbulbifer agarilyticus]|uniref:hypothetical protein n=1 Tax=Microbulbifer agarilyticus TaxID=260552 RepID=UPI001C989B75|nr:hypothetical protein [Microbulbifer agarilyticus]MBY6191896.1 hypothetical protein [Microbulbifer agarilyticus]
MKKSIFVLLAIILSGCDFASDVKELFSEHGDLEKTIQKQYGSGSSVSFDHTNGHFILWVSIPIESVETRIVRNIYEDVYSQAIGAFTDTPNEIYISVGGPVKKL